MARVSYPPGLYQWCLSADKSGPLGAALAGVFAGAVYLLTLTPSISWGDSPELVAAAYQLGVPHPTGYPLYMLLGHAVIRLVPWGDPAYRMNLVSALCAAGAVATLHRLAERLTGSLTAAWVGALVLALAPLFWSQAVIAEVYPLAQLLTLLLLYQIMRWDQTGAPRHLELAALFTGLNVAHHTGVSLLAPGLVGFALTSAHVRAGLRRLPRLVGLMLLPLLLYLYLPIRAAADPWTNWGDTRTLGAALYHVSGRFYRTMMFATPPGNVAERAHELPSLALANLGWPGAVLAIAGVVALLWRPFYLLGAAALRRPVRPAPAFLTAAWNGWRLSWLLGTWLVLTVLWAVHYWIFDYQVFYLPALTALSLLAALGTEGALGVGRSVLGARASSSSSKAPGIAAPGGPSGVFEDEDDEDDRPTPVAGRQIPIALLALALVGSVLYPVATRWKENDRHDDWDALRYGRALTQLLPRNALVFGMGDYEWFPLFYLLAVEKARPDVLVFNLWETSRPQSYRLFSRFRSRDFAVLPVPAFGVPGRQRTEYDFLRSLVEGNIHRRPICFVMERSVLTGNEIREILSPYYLVARSNLPVWECYTTPPAYRAPRLPAPSPPLTFVDGTRLRGFEAASVAENGVQWVRLRYDWQVARRDPMERLQARVWFADRQGQFRTHAGGLPELENIHGLDYGYLPPVERPVEFGEEYWLFVYQRNAGQTYQVRLQLERNGVPVPSTSGNQVTNLAEVTIPSPPRPPVVR